jgi:tRNA(fMet)-specific endonuclease VapC
MKRFLLDTSCAGDYVNRRFGVDVRVRDVAAKGARVGICVPVLGELFAGIELSATRDRNRLRLIRALAQLTLWPFDREAAEAFGRLYALLRRTGRPMQQIDIQIAAAALSLGNCTVVTKDSDFAAIPGLTVENWSDPK